MLYGDDTIRDDREFLLRSALTHNWGSLLDFCAQIGMFLVDTGSAGSPQRASLTRSTSEDVEASRISLVRKQLEACDQWGNNVLHAACFYRPPVNVVRSLLQLAHRYDCPLHLGRALDGSTPLQVACACGASLEVVQLILHPPNLPSGSLAVQLSDQLGATPLSELVIYYTLKVQQDRSSVPLEQVNLAKEPSPLLADFLAKVDALLQIEEHGSRSDALARVVETSPRGLTHLLLSPDALSTVLNRPYPHRKRLRDNLDAAVIHTAGQAGQRIEGRWPLHIAIENGFGWRSLRALLEHNLEAIEERENGLLPFQRAVATCDLDAIFLLIVAHPQGITEMG